MEPRGQVIQSFTGRPGDRVRVHVPFAAARNATLPTEVTVPAERIVFVEALAASVNIGPAPSAPVAVAPPVAVPLPAVVNGNFESGDFKGWTADPNWRVDRNS